MGGSQSTLDSADLDDRTRAALPTWLGGDLSAAETLDEQSTPDLSLLDRRAVFECLQILSDGKGESSRVGAYRRTIFTPTKNVSIGEEVSVVHILEALAPTRHQSLCRTGRLKAVLGDYVDGVLAEQPECSAETTSLAAAVFDRCCDEPRADALSLEQLWEALGQIGIGGERSAQDLLLVGDGGEVGGSRRARLCGVQRTHLRRIAGGDRLSKSTFLQLAANLAEYTAAGGAAAGGASTAAAEDGTPSSMVSGPGIDVQWAVTRHKFTTPGEHLISWHGLEVHAPGCAASNALRINVMPRLPKKKLREPPLPGLELVPPELLLARSTPSKPRAKTLGGVPKACTADDEDYVQPLRKFYYGARVKTKAAPGEVWL